MGYITVKEESKERLHLAREPSIWSYSILVGLIAFGFGAAYYGSDCLLWKVVYVAGAIFLGISCLEDWEDCVFDMNSGQVKLHKLSLMQKLLRPSQEQPAVVTELSGIVDVRVEEEKVRYFGKGHQVVLYFDTGLSMGITDACTFGDNREHSAIADKISSFLSLDKKACDGDDYLGDGSSSEDSFEQIDKAEVSDELAGADAELTKADPGIQTDRPTD
ncbi:cytochrome b-245 chaperone 1-like [Liolophura sinensis]|uniref:cytochrome b-245 chaperone 1-like n=1 Tax=Liolophura sinensis TaxID=3198878 RepID=UPI0031580A67